MASRRAEARARPIAARRSAAPSAKRRQHFLAEEADLLVPVGSPQLEHDVRAARLAVLLDRGDALVRRAGDRLATVEQGIGHLLFRGETAAAPLMFWNLLARYMPPISRAPSRPASRSDSWIDAITVQPMSIVSGSRPASRTLPIVQRT